MKQLKVIAPYLSVFGLFVLLSSLVAPTLAAQNGVDTPDWLGRGLAIAGLILLLAWPVLRFEDLREALGTRQARYGGNALVLIVSLVAILGVLNFFGTRYFRTWDLTENKQFTISDKSIQIMEGLADAGKPVRVTAVFQGQGPEAQEFERLADQYERRHPGAQFEVLDAQVDPFAYNALAQRTGEQLGGRLLVAESGEPGEPDYKHALVYTGFDEQALTEAVVKATREEDKRILFSAGHGEYSLTAPSAQDEQGRSYSAIQRSLESEGYTVETLNLVTSDIEAIDAEALVIAGPQTPFSQGEIDLVRDFLEGGGGLMVMLDPGTEVDPLLAELLDEWGIGYRDDIVLDPARSYLQRPQIPAVVGNGYQPHTITEDFVGSDLVTVFPGSRSLQLAEPAPEGVMLSPLFETTGDAWGETDLTSPQAEPGEEDASGPLVLGVAAEGTGEDGARLVVLGSSQLAADGLLQELQLASMIGGGIYNGEVVLNSANWLAQDELLIGIEPTTPDQRPINAPQNPGLLQLTTALLIPLLVAGVGFWIWWGRR